MPIFEYSCHSCGTRFEKLQKSGTDDTPGCPDCGSVEVRRELSTFFSGSSSASATACYSGG